jgi:glycosyltransferase 2 family protein
MGIVTHELYRLFAHQAGRTHQCERRLDWLSVAPELNEITDALKYLLKILTSLVLFVLILLSLDVREFLEALVKADPMLVCVAQVLSFCLLPMGALKWKIVARLADVHIPIGAGLKATVMAHFINQALPSTVGGDGYRVWYVNNRGTDLVHAIACVASDRIIGLLGLMTIVCASSFQLARIVEEPIARLALVITVLAIPVGLVLALTFRGFIENRRGRVFRLLAGILSGLRTVFASGRDLIAALVVAIVGHLTVALIFFLIALSIEIEISVWEGVAVFSVVFLFSMIPVSIAGWGVREGLLAAGLGLLGVSVGHAVAVGVLFGLTMLVAALPGGLLWLYSAIQPKPAPHQASST